MGRALARTAAPTISVVTAIIAIIAVMHTAGRLWLPIADYASIWFRTWDVGGTHTLLTGPHSRFGWYHPGPAIFFLLAPPLRLLGGSPSGLLVGSLLVSVSCAVGLVALTARTAGQAPALMLAVAAAILCSGFGDRLISPWHPFFCVLPFAVFLVAAWLASAGDGVAATVACVAGTVAAQSHLGALPPVVMVAAAAMALCILRPPPGARPPGGGAAARNLALLGLLWAPPAIEQLTSREGNVSAILHFFRTNSEGVAGWDQGLRMAGAQLLPWGPWLGREKLGIFADIVAGPRWQLTVSSGLVVLAFVMARRFRDDLALRLATIEAVSVVACIVAHAQIRGFHFYYLALWTRPIAMMIVVAPFIILSRRVPARASSPIPEVLRALAVAIVSLTVSVRAFRADVPYSSWSRVQAVVGGLALNAASRGGAVRVAEIGCPLAGAAEAMAVVLEWGGQSVKMTPYYGPEVGEHRTIPPASELPTLVMTTGMGVESFPHRDAAKLIYQLDPLSPEQRAAARALQIKLEHQLMALGRTDLILPLHGGEWWVVVMEAPSIDREGLTRYAEMSCGADNAPFALYALPPVKW